MGRRVTQKTKYLNAFIEHRYWKYCFVEPLTSKYLQIILFKLPKKIEWAKAGTEKGLVEISVLESLELTDTRVRVTQEEEDSIFIKFPLDKQDTLTQVSREYYKFFRGLGEQEEGS